MIAAKAVAAALGDASQEGRNWRCRCPIHDGVSLCLRDGRDSLLLFCWGGCESSIVLAELRRRGLLDDGGAPAEPASRPPRRSKPTNDASNQERATRIWQQSADPRGTLVERYLTGRVLALPPRSEEAIRYHPRCPFKDDRVPAIVALLRDVRTDALCGIHRTALLPDGSDRDRLLGKAMLGRALGAAIKISPDDEVTLGLGIAEGIETALAVIGAGWRPVWAAASAAGIAQFPILAGIEELTIFADSDTNEVGQRSAETCAQRWREAGQLAAVQMVPSAGGAP